ncbi:UrcA family protein [Sphingobium jiangsuense]|uniref:UrcA family protein n=1 Tax=Sphingobium jiangsuense TaxID=870476 RepID=A0A7W6BGN0_9SPHN|nr:UrcA family protein [Sphingobium jiangsuense]MBB3926611.1 UrcA family protein [Sphingobium jiangsuense]
MFRTAVMAGGTACAVLLASATIPAFAQTDEVIVVTGKYGRVPDNIQTLSQNVSYADLDLSTKAGKDELRKRLSLTARFLCDKLGEPATASPPAPSCRDAAVKDALQRVGTIEANFAPRGTGWVAPAPWQAPYPADWTTRYP